MTTQIAVRLPDELVEFLDRAVAEGMVSSRAAWVASAVEREMRRLVSERDAAILREREQQMIWTASWPGPNGTWVEGVRTERVRELRPAHLDKTRPVLVLTRDAARAAMTKMTVAPITSTVKGLSSEVMVGAINGLDHEAAVSIDNVTTVPVRLLGRRIGFLTAGQEIEVARAVVLAYDMDLPVLR